MATTYILFPRYAQPTQSEARALEGCTHATGEPRMGIDKRSGGLAIAFEATAFKSARHSLFEFDALVSAWEKQGCHVSDACSFAPNLLALQPKPDPAGKAFPTPDELAPLEPQALRAREAVALARLETAQVAEGIKQGGELVRQLVPYLVVCVVLGCMLYVGYAAYQAAQNIDIETRRETIERVGKEPLNETLEPQKRSHEAAPQPSQQHSPAEPTR